MAEYEVRAQVPTVDDYIRVRLAAGLSRKTEEAATIGLKDSLFAVTIFNENEPVGIGRIIGDGGCFFEVVDIAVLPKHQQRGVGTLIMDVLIAYVNEHAPKSAYVSLMADYGTPTFYEKFGFAKAELPKAAGMVLRVL